MVYSDEFDALEDEIFSSYGIDAYIEEPEEDYESFGYFGDDFEDEE